MAGYPSRTPGELGRLEDRIASLERQLRRLMSPTAEQYSQTVASQPLVQTTSGETNGPGMQNVAASGAWFEWLPLELTVPDGKSSVEGVVSASAAFLDRTSGGAAYIEMRIVATYPSGIADSSVAFPSAKQSGASVVNNVCTGTHPISQVRLQPGQKVKISVQIRASNPDAFPANAANFVQATVLSAAANNI